MPLIFMLAILGVFVFLILRKTQSEKNVQIDSKGNTVESPVISDTQQSMQLTNETVFPTPRAIEIPMTKFINDPSVFNAVDEGISPLRTKLEFLREL